MVSKLIIYQGSFLLHNFQNGTGDVLAGQFMKVFSETVFSDVDSDELEFIVNEEMQQYQIIHEQVIIQQNKEMNEIIGEGFHHKMTPCRKDWILLTTIVFRF